jgi:hypothetical protein
MTAVGDSQGLYSLPLSEFTTARDRLAQQLRSNGRAEEADLVARLRKPSVAAWALNLAARHHPAAVAELLESHRRLRQAESNEAMQEASLMRTRAVTALTDSAMSELQQQGHAASGPTRDRVNRTLLAVATDPDGEADLLSGTLVKELQPSGGGWSEITLPAVPKTDPAVEAARLAAEARARADRLEGSAIEAERRLDSARQAVTEARRRVKQARIAAAAAAEEAEVAEKSARDLA